LVPIKAQALADTGALMFCIPEHLVLQLKLRDEAEIKVPGCAGFLFVVFVATSGA
jgi:hypothetical protein